MANLPVLTDDGSVWPEDQPAAAPPQPAQPDNGYWIPRILANLWQTAKSGFTLPGDVAQGNASMADPATQRRIMDLATLATAMPGVAPAEAGALNMGLRAPAIVRGGPTSDEIARITARAADLRKGPWPQINGPDAIFEATPEAFERTTSIVPQTSIRSRIPGPDDTFSPIPNENRTGPIAAASKEIGAGIAERLVSMVRTRDPRLMFYNTGPVYEKLASQSIDPASIIPEWAGQVAATSPRTQTPPNLRNASQLLYRRGSPEGPMTEEEFNQVGNPPGYSLMGKQIASAERFGSGAANINSAPKQYLFDRSVQGNMADPVIDTHNIRGTLYQFDQLNPGQAPRGWFTSDEAYGRYRAGGGFGPQIAPGDIDDSLANLVRQGVKKQVEFGPMTGPWYEAGKQLGVQPGQAQSGGWFGYGGVTGLRSPVRTLSQLLGDQLYDTSRAVGTDPNRILDWWSQKKIPLTQNDQQQPQDTQTQIG